MIRLTLLYDLDERRSPFSRLPDLFDHETDIDLIFVP